MTRDTMNRIALALRMVADECANVSVPTACEAVAAKGCRTCGDQWGLCDCEPSAARFVDRGETIFDNQTGLEWEKATRGPMPWQEAMDSCKALRLGGHGDWRLPTVEELHSVVDYERHDPACDPCFGARSSYYWSSTTYRNDEIYAWLVNFENGYTDADFKSDFYSVRAVRGGLALRRFDDSPVAPTAPEPLPPLVGPSKVYTNAWRLSYQNAHASGDYAAGEWERIAREERAAREQERAEAARINDVLAKQAREFWASNAALIKTERERDEARETAARLAVERNALREQREAVLKAMGE